MGSNSHGKMKVSVVDSPWGKRWVKVTLLYSKEFYPSFEDLHRIIRAICYCEDEKYPDGKGRQMVAEFMVDACQESNFEKLAEKYHIPIRRGAKVINANTHYPTIGSSDTV